MASFPKTHFLILSNTVLIQIEVSPFFLPRLREVVQREIAFTSPPSTSGLERKVTSHIFKTQLDVGTLTQPSSWGIP